MKIDKNKRFIRRVFSVNGFKVDPTYMPVVLPSIVIDPNHLGHGPCPPPPNAGYRPSRLRSARLQTLPPVPTIVIRDIKLAKELAKGGRIVQILADENLNLIESESDFRSKETVFSFLVMAREAEGDDRPRCGNGIIYEWMKKHPIKRQYPPYRYCGNESVKPRLDRSRVTLLSVNLAKW